MQLLDWTHPWAPRGPGSLGKLMRFQVCYIKTRNRASVHKSYVVGDLSIAVILKLREGMHFSRSKNARLLNLQDYYKKFYSYLFEVYYKKFRRIFHIFSPILAFR